MGRLSPLEWEALAPSRLSAFCVGSEDSTPREGSEVVTLRVALLSPFPQNATLGADLVWRGEFGWIVRWRRPHSQWSRIGHCVERLGVSVQEFLSP
jgi:hypothetical protein